MRLFELPNGTVLDLDEVCMTSPVMGDPSWLKYEIHLKNGVTIPVFQNRPADNGYPREKFIAAWAGDLKVSDCDQTPAA
jgi:hypothetical protein